MPPKPTCKVVKRQGQTGARIDPKGCKVRSEKDAAGRVTTTNKQGQQKHKVKETDGDHYLFISGNKTTHHDQALRAGYLDNRFGEMPFRVLVDHFSNIAKTGDQ